MRTLLLVRHADAEATRPGSTDRARHLTSLGLDQAEALATHLVDQELPPDLVLTSPATRAWRTAEAVAAPCTADIVAVDPLYDAGGETVLSIIREVEGDPRILAVVGHAPGVPWLVHELADPATSDPAALAEIEYRYPPSTAAVLQVRTAWSGLERGRLASIRLPASG